MSVSSPAVPMVATLQALPVPATYVVDKGGRIAYAHVDADYRNRAEPADVIALLSTLHKAG